MLLLLLAFPVTGCSDVPCGTIKAEGYVISPAGDAASERWGEYIHYHLFKRTGEKTIVLLKGENQHYPEEFITIYFELDGNLKNDYQIRRADKQVRIRARDDRTALWLVYQLIENIASEDDRFSTPELPPALIDFSESFAGFDFTYREPYFRPNLEPDYAPVIGANNVETDWGLWGHNLLRVVEGETSDEVYALVKGKRDKSQFCFSSSGLFTSVCNYIIDNYGDGGDLSYRFMIMPEDNDLVCTCPLCGKQGNTQRNATPAVAGVLRKLAKRFPSHQFFTTAYRTTFTPPAFALPENTGVFLSSIHIPKGVGPDISQTTTRKFMEQLELWRGKSPNIYLWDYAANFDDYLTPLPILYGLQKQFRFFREMNVKGIFLNASGYDYSPFDDVKTFVAGALMMNADADIKELCRQFFKKKYPVSHGLLFGYYLLLEQGFSAKNIPYDMYGGMRQSASAYLDTEKFILFYDALKATIPGTGGEEREKLEKLFTALSFTRLQIAYINGWREGGYATKEGGGITVKSDIVDYLESLGNYNSYPDMSNYKEVGGLLSDYIAEWQTLVLQGGYSNALIDKPIQILSTPDDGFAKPNLLNDGTPGFASDYHQGWYLSGTDDLTIAFRTENNMTQKSSIRLRFLIMEQHGIFPPQKVMVKVNGQLVESVSFTGMSISGGCAECVINTDLLGDKKVEIKMVRRKAEKSIIACDEIRVVN